LPVCAAGIALIEIIGGAHAFTAARVPQQTDVGEINFADQISESGRRNFRAGIPPAQLLKMAQHQTPARQIEAAIAEDAGRGVDATVRVNRHHDVAETRETFGQVTVPGMTGHGDVTGRTGAGERVLNVDIKMFGGPGQSATGGVISVQ
jgi:hypothetical protein